MAHEITERDNLFTVRQAAWHGIGEVLTDYPTRAEAQKIAHPWEPMTVEMYYRWPSFDAEGNPIMEEREVKSSLLNLRDDDGFELGTVSREYPDILNDEMWDIGETVQGGDHSDVMWETAGSLKGGRKVWLLLRLREPMIDKKGGATIPYYALQNDHIGQGSFRGQATMTKIVCDNTAQVADLDAKARGTEFTFRHTKNIRERMEQAKVALAGWRLALDDWALITDSLIDLQFTSDEVTARFMERFIPDPPKELASQRVHNNVERARSEFMGIYNSPTIEGEGIQGTAYGLVQAAIEYSQHFRKSQTKEGLFKRAYLDRSRLTSDAVRIARELTLVGV